MLRPVDSERTISCVVSNQAISKPAAGHTTEFRVHPVPEAKVSSTNSEVARTGWKRSLIRIPGTVRWEFLFGVLSP